MSSLNSPLIFHTVESTPTCPAFIPPLPLPGSSSQSSLKKRKLVFLEPSLDYCRGDPAQDLEPVLGRTCTAPTIAAGRRNGTSEGKEGRVSSHYNLAYIFNVMNAYGIELLSNLSALAFLPVPLNRAFQPFRRWNTKIMKMFMFEKD